MRIQFCSDLHLNAYPYSKKDEYEEFEGIVKPVAKALVLCGDIGTVGSVLLNSFFRWAHDKWETIFWIPGFHESMDCLGSEAAFQKRIREMRESVAVYTNVHVAYRERFFTDDGFIFLACSFWTRVIDPILDRQQPVINVEHEKDVAWLRSQIQVASQPIIVATYIAPTYQLIDDGWQQPAEEVFYAADTEILIKPPVVAWISGYIHKALQLKKEWLDSYILLVTNARGYPGEVTGYRNDAVLRLAPMKKI
jgi:hypothetical protein